MSTFSGGAGGGGKFGGSRGRGRGGGRCRGGGGSRGRGTNGGNSYSNKRKFGGRDDKNPAKKSKGPQVAPETIEINNEIARHASRKQLTEAQRAFQRAKRVRLEVSF